MEKEKHQQNTRIVKEQMLPSSNM